MAGCSTWTWSHIFLYKHRSSVLFRLWSFALALVFCSRRGSSLGWGLPPTYSLTRSLCREFPETRWIFHIEMLVPRNKWLSTPCFLLVVGSDWSSKAGRFFLIEWMHGFSGWIGFLFLNWTFSGPPRASDPRRGWKFTPPCGMGDDRSIIAFDDPTCTKWLDRQGEVRSLDQLSRSGILGASRGAICDHFSFYLETTGTAFPAEWSLRRILPWEIFCLSKGISLTEFAPSWL